MTPHHLRRTSSIALSAIVGLFSSTTVARAQVDLGTPVQSEALSTAAKANPELVEGLAKELGSTPEQAAAAAGVLFGIAKSLLKPDEFASVANVVPGMDALLAAVPAGVVAPSGAPAALSGAALTPGFASSSSLTPGLPMSTLDGVAAAMSAFPKVGISPEMIAKAIPFLSGYLKKYGGAALGSVLGGVFNAGK